MLFKPNKGSWRHQVPVPIRFWKLEKNFKKSFKVGTEMTELSLDLRVGSVFLILVVSAMGFYTPFFLIRVSTPNAQPLLDHDNTNENDEDVLEPSKILNYPFFRCIKAFSAGVILGVAVLHLLSDAIEVLDPVADYPREFSLFEVLSPLYSFILSIFCCTKLLLHITP